MDSAVQENNNTIIKINGTTIKTRKYTKNDYIFAKNHYYDMTSTDIAKKLNTSRSFVLKVWELYNLKGKEIGRQYYGDFNFFKKIDSSNKAYILGLIASDGNIYKRINHQGQLSISLRKKDYELLCNIKNMMSFNSLPVKVYRNQSSIVIVSDTIYNDLIKIGITPNKHKDIDIKNIKIPYKYYADFIRGYFDGDGSISVNKSNNKKNNLPSHYTISISGNIPNLESIKKMLKKFDINSLIIKDKRNKYSKENWYGNIVIGNVLDIKNFIDFIYKNNKPIDLKMQRKYERCINFIKAYKKKKISN